MKIHIPSNNDRQFYKSSKNIEEGNKQTNNRGNEERKIQEQSPKPKPKPKTPLPQKKPPTREGVDRVKTKAQSHTTSGTFKPGTINNDEKQTNEKKLTLSISHKYLKYAVSGVASVILLIGIGFGISSMMSKPEPPQEETFAELQEKEQQVYEKYKKDYEKKSQESSIVVESTTIDPTKEPIKWDLFNSLIGYHTNSGQALNLQIVGVYGDDFAHPIVYKSVPFQTPKNPDVIMMPTFTTQSERLELTDNQTKDLEALLNLETEIVNGEGFRIWNSPNAWGLFRAWQLSLENRQAHFAYEAINGSGWDTEMIRKTDYKQYASKIPWDDIWFDSYRYGGIYRTSLNNGSYFYFQVVGKDMFSSVLSGDVGSADYWNGKLAEYGGNIANGLTEGTVSKIKIYEKDDFGKNKAKAVEEPKKEKGKEKAKDEEEKEEKSEEKVEKEGGN